MFPDGEPQDITMWIENDRPRDPVEQLFLHMIANALYDLAREGIISGTDAKYRKVAQKRQQRSARHWFAESNGATGLTFRMACDALGYDFLRFQRNVLKMTDKQLLLLVENIRVLQRRPIRKGL